MVKREQILLALAAMALSVLIAGCYTVVDTAAGRAPTPAVRERIVYVERAPSENADESGEKPEGDTEEYIENEAASEDEYENDYEQDGREFGLKEEKYLRKYTEYEESDGQTIIKNYYYGYDEPLWYDTWYARYWYDPWYWDARIRPYWHRPYIQIGFGYDPYWWNGWGWSAGWSWGWYDTWGWYEPFHWHEPWYWQPGYDYVYNPWYFRYRDHHHYGDWRPGGGGGNNVVNGPRKVRPDRLEGFGAGRSTGGIMTAGGSSSGKSAPVEADTGRSIRRDGRDGFGTGSDRRRSQPAVSSGTVEKPSGESINTSSRQRNTENIDSATRRNTRAGETARRTEVQNNRERRPQTRVWIRRETNGTAAGQNSETQARRTNSSETVRRQETRQPRQAQQQVESRQRTSDDSTERAVQRQTSNNAPSERVSRPSSSSSGRSSSPAPSVSRSSPSSGRSSGGGSGRSSSGQSSRPSTSQSGSRRR